MVASAAREGLVCVSAFPLQVDIYLIIIIIINYYLKQSSLKVMKPTDPGKCAQPI